MEKDFIILNLEKEYPGYTGTEKWLIITDLSEKEFAERHPEQYLSWNQAVIMSMKMGAVIARSRLNDRKHARRKQSLETSFETLSEAQAIPVPNNSEARRIVNAAVSQLPEIQRKRIILNCIQGYSISEIAEHEHRSWNVVQKSISKGKKNLRKLIESYQKGEPKND